MALASAPMSVRLLPIQISMHKLIAAMHTECFDDSWNAYTISQVMRMPGAFGFVAVMAEGASSSSETPVGFAVAESGARWSKWSSPNRQSAARRGCFSKSRKTMGRPNNSIAPSAFLPSVGGLGITDENRGRPSVP